MELPPLLSAQQVATALGIAHQTVCRQSKEGTFIIPALRFGKQWRYRKTDLAAVLGCPVEDVLCEVSA